MVTGMRDIITPANEELLYCIPTVSPMKYMTGWHMPIMRNLPIGLPLRDMLNLPEAAKATITSVATMNLMTSRTDESVC